MARRASDAAGIKRRIIGVARFSTPGLEPQLQDWGIDTVRVVVRFALTSLTVAPANPKPSRLGDTLTFTTSGQDSLGSPVAKPQVSWISRTPARLTIDPVTGLVAIGPTLTALPTSVSSLVQQSQTVTQTGS